MNTNHKALFMWCVLAVLPIHCHAVSPETPPASASIAGVFVSTDSELSNGDDEAECDHTFRCLRFYPDGVVLEASICISGDIFTDSNLGLFDQDKQLHLPRGKYQLTNGRITFSTTAQPSANYAGATTKYSGQLKGKILILDSVSSNGYKDQGKIYRRVRAQ